MTRLVLMIMMLAIDWLADRGQKATVLLFTRTDCPVSNRYAPEVRRLAERFSGRGVEFVLVYPEAGATDESIEQHRREYGYPMAAVRDPDYRYVREAKARVTPEAVVLVRGQAVYRGRIDDRFVTWGKARPEPTRRDLAEVLDRVVAGQSVAKRETKAIGCAIEKLSSSRDGSR